MALSRREREMMDVVYRLGEASGTEIRGQMADPPSYSAVRATLRILMEKGHLEHRQDGARYLYRPTVPAGEASRSALRHLVQTFFAGSSTRAAAALLDLDDESMSSGDVERLRELLAERTRANDSGDE